MGAETAPVARSMACPACTARVSIFILDGFSRSDYDFKYDCRSCRLGFAFDGLPEPRPNTTCNCLSGVPRSRRLPMSIYEDDDVFRMDCAPFQVIVDCLEIGKHDS